MTGRDLFVVLNPASDRGRAARLEPRLRAWLATPGTRVQIARTERRGHARELAASAARDGWSVVVAVGGDGVVHEVVNGLMRADADRRPAFGVVPAGTGNDFAKMLSLPAGRPEVAAQRIVAARPRPVDVGRVSRWTAEGGGEGEWHFANGIGLGFDAQVAVEASGIRRLRGLAVYAAALARTLRRLRAPRVRIEVDGREIADRPLILATLANGACHGGGFWLCPAARIDDGLLDVLVADARGVREVLALVPQVMRGRHLGARGVTLVRGRTVRVWSEEPLPIHADGEIVAAGVRELEAEVLPGALRVLA